MDEVFKSPLRFSERYHGTTNEFFILKDKYLQNEILILISNCKIIKIILNKKKFYLWIYNLYLTKITT